MNPEHAISHILPNSSLSGMKVLIRGAGEMASGVAYRLACSGFRVLMTEISTPLAVRRAVSYCEAVYDGSKIVEGRTARLIQHPEEAEGLWARAELPVLIDPHMTCRSSDQAHGHRGRPFGQAQHRAQQGHGSPDHRIGSGISTPRTKWTWPLRPTGGITWAV